MKLFIKSALPVILAFILNSNTAFAGDNVGQIVIKVDDITRTEYNKIVKDLTGIPECTMEFGCSWSGVFVFKLNNTNLNHKGDIIVFFKSRLTKIVNKKRIDVLDTILTVKDDVSAC